VELTRWNVQEYELTDGNGDIAYIMYRPLTQGWRTRHLEISLNLQRLAEKLTGAQGLPEGEVPSNEQYEELVKAQMEAEGVLSEFRKDLFGDLIVGCRNLTINDKEPTRAELVQTIVSLEDLSESLSTHILSSGQISEAQGKD
jgi:hypothetical protein